LDEFRVRLVHLVGDCELDRFPALLKFNRAARMTFVAHFGDGFVSPLEDELAERLDFEDFAGVGDTAIGHHELPAISIKEEAAGAAATAPGANGLQALALGRIAL
jgi:hypothetical protein